MFVGHGLLAFGVAASVAHALGWSRDRALAVGAIAGAFGMVPDVDVLYAPAGLLVGLRPEAFWAAANVVHRTVTHSLVVGVVAAVAAWLIADALVRHRRARSTASPSRAASTARSGASPRRATSTARSTANPNRARSADNSGADSGNTSRDSPGQHPGLGLGLADRIRIGGASGLLVGLVVLAAVISGPLAAVVTTAFALAVGLTALAAVRFGVGSRATGGAALVGLLSHPLGDLFTGTPPALLYPFDVTLVAERVVLHADPTMHLLGAMGIELATAWFALLVFLHVDGHNPTELLAGRAGLGVGYAGVAPVLVPPTLDVSYHFVFSVLAIGVIAATASRNLRRRPCPRRLALNGLAAITLATAAYAAVYLGL